MALKPKPLLPYEFGIKTSIIPNTYRSAKKIKLDSPQNKQELAKELATFSNWEELALIKKAQKATESMYKEMRKGNNKTKKEQDYLNDLNNFVTYYLPIIQNQTRNY